MRERILRVALIASALAILVTGVPAGFAIARIVLSGERTELQGIALGAAIRVGPAYRRGDSIELPAVENGVQLGVYDPTGVRRSGSGPERLDVGQATRVASTPVSSTVGGQLVEIVPVSNGERVIGQVRAASSRSSVWARTAGWLLALLASALAALFLAGAYSRREARDLAQRVGALTGAVTALGEGDFGVVPPVSGVAELDRAGRSLRATSLRLADLVDRERAFSARASHQLRTPLTRMRLALETGLAGDERALRSAARHAVESADALAGTIDDVLALAREENTGVRTSPANVVEEIAAQWREDLARAGRRVAVRIEPAPDVAMATAALRQAVAVLVDNAVRHGSGTVTLVVRDSFDVVALDVVDEGTGPPVDPGRDGSLGLGLALTLVERAGGRLVSERTEGTRFTLLLPAVE